jgi:hypothetical protein
MMAYFHGYQGKPLKSVAKGDTRPGLARQPARKPAAACGAPERALDEAFSQPHPAVAGRARQRGPQQPAPDRLGVVHRARGRGNGPAPAAAAGAGRPGRARDPPRSRTQPAASAGRRLQDEDEARSATWRCCCSGPAVEGAALEDQRPSFGA